MSDETGSPKPREGEPRTFRFGLSFGREPPPDQRAEVHETKITLESSRLRIDDGDQSIPLDERLPTEEDAREAEAWERLSRIGTGTYPDTARVHSFLKTIVTTLVLAVPVALLILGIATGQSTETVFFMTLGGLIVAVIFIKSIP
jgi:hypothetical protein